MTRRRSVRQADIERACRAVVKATGSAPMVIAYPDGRIGVVAADPGGSMSAPAANDDDGGAAWDAALATD